jgi:hypothetical protein
MIISIMLPNDLVSLFTSNPCWQTWERIWNYDQITKYSITLKIRANGNMYVTCYVISIGSSGK